MIEREKYDRIIKEHFDIMDNTTRKVLLNLNEADQNNVLVSLTTKLYDKIVKKVDDIDYGSIPKSKGDITKIENYEEMVECLNIIDSLLMNYNQDKYSVDIIKKAIENIKSRKGIFEKGFTYNLEFPMVTYSTITLAIVSSISLMISSCIDFIKDPANDNFNLTIDKVSLSKSKEGVLFKNLDNFNKACSNGQLDNSLDYILKTKTKNLLGTSNVAVVAGSIALVGLILNIIPILRELIFFFYYSRTKMSDYLELQAELLTINAYNVQNNQSMNKKEREAIAKKQLKLVDTFKKISNKLAIKVKETEKKTNKEIADDTKQYKITDVVDSVPDSAASSLF